MEAEDRLGDLRVDQMIRKAFVGHCMMQVGRRGAVGMACGCWVPFRRWQADGCRVAARSGTAPMFSDLPTLHNTPIPGLSDMWLLPLSCGLQQIGYALHLGHATPEGLTKTVHQLRQLVEQPPDVPQLILNFVVGAAAAAACPAAMACQVSKTLAA